jgi:hypothetical protein
MDLFVQPDGTVSTLYTEVIDLAALGLLQIERASDVEPDATGRWWAQLRAGPKLGPFARRSQALRAEVDWLLEHRLQQH